MAILALFAVPSGCVQRSEQRVVVYTSVDREVSEPILKDFERRTGIHTDVVYDVEAAKAIGLMNRLIAERDRPQADVFWNSECVRTVQLQRHGILEAYQSPSAADIPKRYVDPEGFWTGYATRARVLLVNTRLVSEAETPGSVLDLAHPRWRGRIGFCRPLVGTAAAHSAGLFLALGEGRARRFFRSLRANEIKILPGNAMVRDRVVSGELAVGIVDTDDALSAIRKGHPVRMVFPDQNGMGTFIIPNTVAMIAGAPHPDNARRLVDDLLSTATEAKLAASHYAQIPVRPNVPPPSIGSLSDLRVMLVDYRALAEQMERSNRFLQEEFVR